MALYEYACARCGRFDVRLAIGTATNQYRCPDCGQPARRVFSSPALRQGSSRPVASLLEQEEKSREAPDVVSSVPPRAARGPRQAPNPMLGRLPRP